jgi:sigma-E factor negative regulatory protein RseA
MTDKILEQISALVDDELPSSERALLLKRMEADADLRGTWGRYNLIRDALHHELPERIDTGLADRVMAALDEEPALQARRSTSGTWAGALRPLTGLAIAASVAGLAIVGLQHLRSVPGSGHGPAPVTVAAVTPASGGLVKVGTRWETDNPDIQNRLNGLLMNHSEYAASTNLQGMLHYVRIAGYDTEQ